MLFYQELLKIKIKTDRWYSFCEYRKPVPVNCVLIISEVLRIHIIPPKQIIHRKDKMRISYFIRSQVAVYSTRNIQPGIIRYPELIPF